MSPAAERLAARRHFQAARYGRSSQYELTTLLPDGRFADWHMKNVPICFNGQIDGVFLISADMTAKKQIERALASSEEMHRLITDNIKDLVSIISPDGGFKYVPPSCRDVLGYDPETLIGRSGFDFLLPCDEKESAAAKFAEIKRRGIGAQARIRCRRVLLEQEGDIRVFFAQTASKRYRWPGAGRSTSC